MAHLHPSGTYTWKLDITKAELQGTCYTSPIFRLVGFTWLLKFYPDHKAAPGNATATLYLVDIPPSISQITVRRKIHIAETNTISDQTKTFKCSKGQGWPKNTLLTKSIRHIKHFTFHIDMTLITKYSKYGNKLKVYMNERNNLNKYKLQELRINSLTAKLNILTKTVEKMEDILSNIQTQITKNGEFKQNEDSNLRIKISEYNHNQNINELQVLNAENLEFKDWMLQTVKLPMYYKIFIQNGIDTLDVVQLISHNALDMIGINKIGHKMRILREIEILKETNGGDRREGIREYY